MALNLEQKKAVVAEVNEVASGALSAIAAEYRGLPVGDMTRLRAEARDKGVYLRLIGDFSKDKEQVVVKLISVGGQLYEASELNRLASLPTKEQAIGLLMGVMKAPVEKLVRTLAEPHAKLVRTIAAIRDQRQAA